MLLQRKTATLCRASRTYWMYSMVLSTSAPWTCSVATTRWRCISTRARRLRLRHTLGVQLNLTPCHLACQTPHLLFRDEWRGMLRGLNWHTCLIYLDDIIVFSNTFEEHLKRLRLVFNRLREANLKLKPKKCHFRRRQVQFLQTQRRYRQLQSSLALSL